MPPTFMRGFVDGFQHAEKLMRQALNGHPDSELWGENGLISATMRCVEAVQSDSAKAKGEARADNSTPQHQKGK
jgi:hypothetical protein